MSANYQQLLTKLRDEGRKREELYLIRYTSGPSVALQLAKRWRDALSSEFLDWTELSAIREEARAHRAVADVAFFGFINGLERDYVSLRQAELEAR